MAVDLAGQPRVEKVETRPWCERFQIEGAMRSVSVVMVDLDAQHTLKLSPACDQESVETVAADRADPAFSEGARVWRPIRSTAKRLTSHLLYARCINRFGMLTKASKTSPETTASVG